MKALTISDAEAITIELQGEIRRSPEARYTHRLHAILMIAQGVSVSEVSDILGDSPRTVQYWVNRFNDEGFDGLMESGRPGRPRKLSDDQIAEIKSALNGHPTGYGLNASTWDGKTLSSFIKQQYNLELGVRQCQRFLRQIGFRLRRPGTPSPKRRGQKNRYHT